ncbi:hypothetical protein E8E11_008342 [Didymella keratinophila]|nr:hypothetical protein E8E11_008342 [Didymella keratinophila]
MSRYNRHDPWAEPTQTTNANRRRVFDEDDGTSNMQMARRAQQPSRPSHSTTSGALTRRTTERNRPAERVESWRDEKRSEDLSGAMSHMRVSERPPAASRPRPRPRSPSPERPSPPQRRERETPRRPAAHQRAPSPSPSLPARRRPSPPPARNRRTPSPDWNENDEPVSTRQLRRPAPRSPSPPIERTRSARSPPSFKIPSNDDFGVRRRARKPMDFSDSPPPRSRGRRQLSNNNNNSSSSFSYSITTTSYSSGGCTTSHTQSTINGQRMRDTYRSTRVPRCPFCRGYHSDEPTIWYS